MWRNLVNRPKARLDNTSESVLGQVSAYHIQFMVSSITLALSCIHSATYRGLLKTPGRHPVFGNDGTLVAWVTVS
jgi:hypothetical protein